MGSSLASRRTGSSGGLGPGVWLGAIGAGLCLALAAPGGPSASSLAALGAVLAGGLPPLWPTPAERAPAWLEGLAALALALVPLVLAATADVHSGSSLSELGPVLAWALVLVFGQAWARARAARGASTLYSGLWALSLIGVPLFVALASIEASEPGPISVAELTPSGWFFAAASHDLPTWSDPPFGALAIVVLLIASAGKGPRGRALAAKGAAGLALLFLLGMSTPLHAGQADSSSRSSRLGYARVQLQGPLEGAELWSGSEEEGKLVLSAHLEAGEELEVELPIPLPRAVFGETQPAASAVHCEPAEQVHVLGWSAQAASVELPAELAQRPPVASSGPQVGFRPIEWIVLVALGLLLEALRRRPGRMIAAALVASGAVAGLVWWGRAPSGGVQRTYELSNRSELMLVVDAAWGSLPLVPERPVLVEVAPPAAAVQAVAVLDSGRLSGVELRAPGAELRATWSEPSRLRVPSEDPLSGRTAPGRNDLAELDSVFVRGPDGVWQQLDRWGLGPAPGLPLPEALPEGSQAGPQPPGTLNPALPLGRSLWIGRVSDPRSLVSGAQGLEEAPPREAWVRALGE